MTALLRAARAWPTLFRVSFAGMVAYRAEFLVWVLTTTMPFIMMALMTSVAKEAPIGRYDVEGFTAYYLATLLVRLLTGAWVVWEMTQEIRQGTMALRLLRPIHPIVCYAADNLAALPLRGLLAIPLVLSMLVFSLGGLTSDPWMIAAAALSIAMAWMLNFLLMCCIGTLAFYVESATSLFEVWLGVWVVLSGYLIPLDLFPAGVVRGTSWLPFRLMLDLPVRLITGGAGVSEAIEGLAMQAGWILALAVSLHLLWRAGLRRFAAFGG